MILTAFGPRHGWGHRMRCTQLLAAWKRFSCIWMYDGEQLSQKRGDQIQTKSRSFQNTELFEFIKTKRIDVLFVDSPAASGEFLHSIKTVLPGLKIVAFENYYLKDFRFDLHISTGSAPEREAPARLTRRNIEYLIVRDAALQRGWKQRRKSTKSKLLITFGGADPRNYSKKALNFLKDAAPKDLQSTLLIGPSNPHREHLKAQAHAAGIKPLIGHPTRTNVPRLMSQHDAAIVNSGTTVNEALSVGIPLIAVPQHQLEREWLRHLEKSLNFKVPKRLTANNLQRILNPSRQRLEQLRQVSDWMRHQRRGAVGIEQAILEIL